MAQGLKHFIVPGKFKKKKGYKTSKIQPFITQKYESTMRQICDKEDTLSSL